MNIKIGSIAKGADNAAGGTFPPTGSLKNLLFARDDARTMNAIEKRKECAFLLTQNCLFHENVLDSLNPHFSDLVPPLRTIQI